MNYTILKNNLLYFLSSLFVGVYLLILFDRLIHGLPAGFLISIIFAILILFPTIVSALLFQKKAEAQVTTRGKAFIKMFLVSIPLAFISGCLFWIIKMWGVSGEEGVGLFITIPIFGLIFISIPALVIGLISALSSTDENIKKATKIIFAISVFFLVVVVGLLINCTFNGCRNVGALAKKAISANDPAICKERKFWVDIYEDFNGGYQVLFQTKKDPYPSVSVESDCLFTYASQKGEQDSAKICINIIGPGKTTCINNIIEDRPDSKTCEELEGVDPNVKNLEFYNNAYSICYSALARSLQDEKYCEKVDQNGRENRNRCYIEVAVYKNDVSMCEKLGPEPLYPQNDGLGKPDNPETKKYCIEYVQRVNSYR